MGLVCLSVPDPDFWMLKHITGFVVVIHVEIA